MTSLTLRVLLAGFLTFGWLSSSVAQDFTAEQRAACRGDYQKFCQGTRPGGGRVLACLSKQYGELSESCKKVVDGQKK
jgi:cysteine rich repeat protein